MFHFTRLIVIAALILTVFEVHAQAIAKPPRCRQDLIHGWVASLPTSKTTKTCPAASAAWKLRSFPLDAAGTRTLCSYEWKLASDPTKVGLPAGLDYQPDCMAIGVHRKELAFAPQPAPATTADIDEIEADFLDALDAPASFTPLRAAISSEYPTLAFIDALPIAVTSPQKGALQHGNSLQTLAGLLAGCDHAPCRFRYTWYDKAALFPYPGGKVVGSPLDSAESVLNALKHFNTEQSEHLVLSIGLGFEPDSLCHASSNSLVVQALREAIRRTACETDAIILAPVGNKRDDDVTTDMLYPARFETEELRCDGKLQGRPLVTAISGVDLWLKPLASSRAVAKLVTFGGPWAYAGDGLDEQLNPSTASSVAVAGAGPAFALAWWLRDDLDAQGLLKALKKAGIAGRGDAAASSVIRVCSSLKKLCSSNVGRCAELPKLCPHNLKNPLDGLPLPAAEPRPAAPGPSGFTRPTCLGRGQRIEPSGPGE